MERLQYEILCMLGGRVAQIRVLEKGYRDSARERNAIYLITYFVRTGNPRSLGTKQRNNLLSKVTKNKGFCN